MKLLNTSYQQNKSGETTLAYNRSSDVITEVATGVMLQRILTSLRYTKNEEYSPASGRYDNNTVIHSNTINLSCPRFFSA